ncbi:MAG TPA: arylsulfatase [Puia sp.]|jgi:arylsulfatase
MSLLKFIHCSFPAFVPYLCLAQAPVAKTGHWAQSSAFHTPARPNIVYILADDLGYGDLGCYGQDKVETPNIDMLAKEGMLFTQHYALPLCAPSRCALMTGRHGGKTYIRGNDEWPERGDIWSFKAMENNPSLEGQLPIPDSTITLPKLLKSAGYTTAMVGKWGLGGPATTGIPNNQGFDYFYGSLCQRQDHQYYPGHLWENTLRVYLDNKIIDPNYKLAPDADPSDPKNYALRNQYDYAPDLMIRAAIRFIDRNKNNPFFLYYPSPLPHASMQAPARWVDYYHKKFGDEKPYLGGSYVPCQYPRATRAAMISLLDEQVGQIVTELKKWHLYANTIIMFASDNGPSNEGGADCAWFNSGGPFPSAYGRGKGFLYEGGIREPFLVSWQGKIKQGVKSDALTSFWDLLPTLCQLTGIKTPPAVDGISYLPTLLGKPAAQKKHDYLYFELAQNLDQQAVRWGHWKGIRLNIHDGNMKIKLFDLDKDLKEENDVADQHPDIVQHMAAIMKQEHHRADVNAFRIKALDDPQDTPGTSSSLK